MPHSSADGVAGALDAGSDASAIFTPGSQTLAANAESNVVIRSATLSFGGSVVTAATGEVVSLARNGIVLGSTTIPFSEAEDAAKTSEGLVQPLWTRV